MDEKEKKKLALDFLICCYFGQSVDLCMGAIDRAYVDMASHTLHFINKDSVDEKWESRLNASNTILSRICNYSGAFLKWHCETIEMIKERYNGKLANNNEEKTLTEGQAQKWLNMTVKYLYVFKVLLEKDDDRLKQIKTFLDETSEDYYKMPIDSYVLKEIGGNPPWSGLSKEEYEKTSEKSFLWELEKWEELMQKYKKYDKGTYQRFYKEWKNKHVKNEKM